MTSLPRTRRRRRRVRLGILLALASTVSAISLNDLQAVQDGVLPVACSLVYHTAIQGCTTADFTKGETCSLSCIAGVKQIEDDVENSCQTVDNAALALLSDAQRGSLVLKLCIGNDFTLASTTTTTSSTPLTTQTPLLTTSRTIGSFTTIPFPTTTPILTTTAQTTPVQSTATETTLTFVPPLTSSTSELTTSQLSSTTTESVTTQSSTSTTTAVTSTSTSPSQTTDGRGGGSPFDTTSDSPKLSMHWSLCLAICAVLASLRLS